MAKANVKAKANDDGTTMAAGGFEVGQAVVYPTHGLANVDAIVEETVAGYALKMMVLSFAKDRMTVRVPLAKVKDKGVRALSDDGTIARAVAILGERPRSAKGLWARRANEFEAKIATGGLLALAEVARDCFRSEVQEEASFSQKRIYGVAMDRIVAEVAAVRAQSEIEVRREVEAAMAAASTKRGAARPQVASAA